ncbi:hypothetical protein BDR26DRAFT_703365 [Obelidium mucronatum]|nr:hypothetical protein BDR26DRAFT_703365 [Obelidium mucronatum]
MEQQQHQHLQQQKEQQQQQEALERLEKLRLKKEARGKAKEMIGELSEMAEYFRSTEAEQQRQLKDSTEGGKQDQGITKEEKEEDEDWFVGKSFGVAKGSVTEMETPEVDEKEYVIQDRKEEDALYDEKESAQEVGFTPKWMRAAAASQARREGREEENAESSESDGILKPHHITRALEMERGGNIAVLDVSCEMRMDRNDGHCRRKEQEATV